MTTYTIGQVVERSGFSTSSLRYYEQHGLLKPVIRTDAGYRLYDERSLARLRFIARAKELGCTLEEIADLAELWAADDCGPVQRRLHELVTDKIADARRRSADLVRFTAELQTAATHLGAKPVDGACGSACACLGGDTASSSSGAVPVVLGEGADSATACTLLVDEIPERTDDWHRLVGHVTDRQTLPGGEAGVRLVLDPTVPLAELARLTVAEQGCCSFFSFAITVDGRGIGLEVRAPADVGDVVTAVFGTAS